jgi:hypothetical protein
MISSLKNQRGNVPDLGKFVEHSTSFDRIAGTYGLSFRQFLRYLRTAFRKIDP